MVARPRCWRAHPGHRPRRRPALRPQRAGRRPTCSTRAPYIAAVLGREVLAPSSVLVAIWVLAWGSVSWPTSSGVVVVAALLLVVPDVRPTGAGSASGPGPSPAGRALPARVVVERRADPRGPRPAAPLPTPASSGAAAGVLRRAADVIANLVAMTPGTTPIEVEADPPVMYVHVLRFTSERGGLGDSGQVLAFGREAIAAAG